MSPHQETQESNSVRHVFRDSAVLLTLGTGIGYAAAYSFETGYGRYFGVPLSVVSPTPAVVVFAVISVVITLALIFQMAGISRVWLKGFPEIFRFRFEGASLLTVSAILTYGLTLSTLLAALFTYFVFLGRYIPALFAKGQRRQKIELIDDTPDEAVTENPMSKFAQANGRAPLLIFLSFIFTVPLAQGLGVSAARFQREFHVIQHEPDSALIRSYGDTLIAIKFDGKKRLATGEVRVFKLSESNAISTTPQRIGPLKGFNPTFLDITALRDR